MTAASMTWRDTKARRLPAAIVAAFVALSVVGVRPAMSEIADDAGRLVSVIVRELPGAGSVPERAVAAVGGSVGQRLDIIGGFVAEVPEAAMIRLKAVDGVHSVTPNAEVRLNSDAGDSSMVVDVKDGFDQKAGKTLIQDGKLYVVQKVDGDRADIDAGRFTSYSLPASVPARSTIVSARVYVRYYQESDYRGVTTLEVAGADLRNPVALASMQAPTRLGDSREFTLEWDVSEVVDTPEEANALSFVVRNGGTNGKKVVVNRVHAELVVSTSYNRGKALTVADGFDQRLNSLLSALGTSSLVQTSDDVRATVEPGSFTSYSLAGALPDGATVLSTKVFVEHFEDRDFQGSVRVQVAGGTLQAPTVLASTTAATRLGGGNEAVYEMDATSAVNTVAKLRDLKVVVQNASTNLRRAYLDRVHVRVIYTEYPGAMLNATRVLGARKLWEQGVTGKGVDVALVDSGVVPVEGLAGTGKVVNGADLSYEGAAADLRYLDTYGHGTHMAGVMLGRDSTVPAGGEAKDTESFQGVAPGARLVNVKVAGASGATDVSQVIAGIEWVIRHRNADGMNIRVMNLSFGTDGVQDYLVDPLTYAVEQAWHSGIVVVVSAGNEGFGSAKMNNPAYDPFVIAVGANDTKATFDINDDEIPSWSSAGDGKRNPDVVAPGKSILGLRAEGSHIDMQYPEGVVNERFFKGSGTSQAAAMTSGAAALLLQQRPNLTPDQVKHLLTTTARKLPVADPVAQGNGMVSLADAAAAATPGTEAVQQHARAAGTGSLELSRGSGHLMDEEGTELRGEVDAWGNDFDGIRWSGCLADQSCSYWDGIRWSADDWSGIRWSGIRWSGIRWSGIRWSSEQWDGIRWSGIRWSGIRWSSDGWAGIRWSGIRWSSDQWDGIRWSGIRWSGIRWSSATWD